MILRLWRGWPDAEHAAAYEQLLREHIAPSIAERRIPGLRDLTVLRRLSEYEVLECFPSAR